MGDYHSAMKALAPISINKRGGLHTKVIACYVSLYYYTGFVYMMTRRFSEAIRTFSHILVYVSRIKAFHTKSYQQDAVRRFGL
jgi:translation initiation factor 3 subunit L